MLAEKALRDNARLYPEPFLLRKSRQLFYNTSPLDLKKLMGDQHHIGENLRSYIQGFSTAVRSIVPASMAGLTKMLFGLRRQEAVFVGQAAMLPSRILVRSLEPSQLPRSHDIDFDAGWQTDPMTPDQLMVVAARRRYQQR